MWKFSFIHNHFKLETGKCINSDVSGLQTVIHHEKEQTTETRDNTGEPQMH